MDSRCAHAPRMPALVQREALVPFAPACSTTWLSTSCMQHRGLTQQVIQQVMQQVMQQVIQQVIQQVTQQVTQQVIQQAKEAAHLYAWQNSVGAASYVLRSCSCLARCCA